MLPSTESNAALRCICPARRLRLWQITSSRKRRFLIGLTPMSRKEKFRGTTSRKKIPMPICRALICILIRCRKLFAAKSNAVWNLTARRSNTPLTLTNFSGQRIKAKIKANSFMIRRLINFLTRSRRRKNFRSQRPNCATNCAILFGF